MADEDTKITDSETAAARWLAEIAARGDDADEKKWIARGKDVVRRYRDDRPTGEEGSRFNILWSNVETILPATYARTPKADVTRRNKDADPVARTAAQILERALQYEINEYPDFGEAMRLSIKDRLLPGRGVAWVRFETYEVDRPEAAEIPQDQAEVAQLEAFATPDILERACVDYVYWEDFRTGEARIWSDVPWVARRAYMTRKDGMERFGDGFRNVKLTRAPVGVDDNSAQPGAEDSKKAEVWEIWDKASKAVYWIATGYPKLLDQRPDPYGLEGFFPCPKPLYATQTSDQLIPVPDYCLYQDQAKELDGITSRISGLIRALRMSGAYDASQPALARILSAADNTLIPVEDWARFSEKGIAGVMSWVPIKEVAQALREAYLARDQIKQVIYEITGISDIIRGATKASETATAQQIKSQFGSLRLQDRQRDIAEFATAILRIKAEMMMDLYSPQTLVAMSGIDQTLDAAHVEQAIALMKSEPLRSYQIEIAADSLVAIDEAQEKQDTVEFLGAAGGFIKQAVEATQTVPELAPLAMQLLMMGVRAFKAGRPVEAAFEQFQQQIEQRPPVDPNAGAQAQQQAEMAKLQQQTQVDQMRLQADVQISQVKAQTDLQIERERMQMQAQLEQQRAQMQAQVDQHRAEVDAQAKAQMAADKLQFDRWKAELDAAVRVQVANITSKAKLDDAATQTATREISDEVRP